MNIKLPKPLVTYVENVTECPTTRQPIWKYEFYKEYLRYTREGMIVNRKKHITTINDYMSYDDIRLMEELILEDY